MDDKNMFDPQLLLLMKNKMQMKMQQVVKGKKNSHLYRAVCRDIARLNSLKTNSVYYDSVCRKVEQMAKKGVDENYKIDTSNGESPKASSDGEFIEEGKEK